MEGVPLKRNDFFDKKYNREKKGFVLHVGKGVFFGNSSISLCREEVGGFLHVSNLFFVGMTLFSHEKSDKRYFC